MTILQQFPVGLMTCLTIDVLESLSPALPPEASHLVFKTQHLVKSFSFEYFHNMDTSIVCLSPVAFNTVRHHILVTCLFSH